MERHGRVILVGTLASWDEPKLDGDRIWCINRGYLHQPNLDRLYLMDPLTVYFKAWGEEFVQEINALGVKIILREPRGYIPNGVQFNYQDSFDNFSISFFGATVANAIAHAIEEGIHEIVLHKMYLQEKSQDYLHHKAAVGFWVGQAIAHGMKVTVDPDSFLNQRMINQISDEMARPHGSLPVPDIQSMVLREQQRQRIRDAAKADVDVTEHVESNPLIEKVSLA